jgi:DNA topoisomerase-6 subunit B
MYLNRRNRVKQEGERRSIFLRYLGEVASAVAQIHNWSEPKQKDLYQKLLHVAKRKTAEADTRLDDRGKKIEEDNEEFGENVLIVSSDSPDQSASASAS